MIHWIPENILLRKCKYDSVICERYTVFQNKIQMLTMTAFLFNDRNKVPF